MSLLAAAIVIAALGFAAYRSAGTTVIMLMRSAEKDPGTIPRCRLKARSAPSASLTCSVMGVRGLA